MIYFILYLAILDNITVKGSQIIYNKEESLLDIYRYISKYIIQLNGVLTDLKQAKCIIFNTKSHFYKDKIIVVGYYYNEKGQYLKKLKIAKIIY